MECVQDRFLADLLKQKMRGGKKRKIGNEWMTFLSSLILGNLHLPCRFLLDFHAEHKFILDSA